MAKQNAPLLAFNRGLISNLALARTDLKVMALSAEIQTNWMPRALGSMMLRPGTAYVDQTLNNSAAFHVPFVFSASDVAIIELTDGNMRVRVDEAIIARPAVSTVITNGTFNTDLSGWTDADESGAASAWAAANFMGLTGTGYNAAIRTQQVTVASGDHNKEHGIRLIINRGEVTLKVGSSAGADDYVGEVLLKPGIYSFACTPTTDLYIRLSSLTRYQSLVDSITIEGAGDMSIPTPWAAGSLSSVRHDQSGDVVFVACAGVQQRRIERHGPRSWALAFYAPNDGPFLTQNTTTLRLTPSGINGDITISATAPVFKQAHAGGLFSLTSSGQLIQNALSGDGQYSDPVTLTGVAPTRNPTITIAGTWTGTLTLRRSADGGTTWTDVSTYTTNQSFSYNDGQPNSELQYQIGFNTGGYGSGTANITIAVGTGSLTGIVRITGYTSSTSVSAAVLKPLGGTSASADWAEGTWSDYRGWPTSGCFFEGRLWWAGKDKILGSVSDAFESYDASVEGDSGPIQRSIGSGPVDTVNWLLPLLRLILGCELAEKTARSSSLDEPLTPTNFNLKDPSTRGSSNVAAVKIDAEGIFVRNSRVFQLTYTESYSVFSDYGGSELTIVCPEVGQPGITRLAVQRYPDTRVHCPRSDGKVAVLVFDPAEELKCWILVETDGIVEDVFTLPGGPGTDEDLVYYLVNRTVNGSTKRYLERWALESECQGGTLNKQADSFSIYSGSATQTITGLDHHEGKEVVVWADGKDVGTLTDADGNRTQKYTVSGGQIVLDVAASNVVVGLPYTAQLQSTKLAYAAQAGTALAQVKRVDHLGFIMANTHAQGLRYGPDFDHLDDLPLVEKGTAVDPDYIWPGYDFPASEFNGVYDSDSRICLQAQAPRPCTVLAAIVDIETNEKL